jgi:hypothetical protein
MSFWKEHGSAFPLQNDLSPSYTYPMTAELFYDPPFGTIPGIRILGLFSVSQKSSRFCHTIDSHDKKVDSATSDA